MLYQMMRPDSFDMVFGNKPVISSLKSFLKKSSEEIPHTFLFVGERGCGKTTVARIMAKELGCDSVDLYEMNAANTRGIDSVRDILEQVHYAPLSGKCKVFIVDESHQLTGAAQEAFLKDTEDVPDHVYFFFFFCTTNPKGLLKTLRSRCTAYEFEKLRPEVMKKLIAFVADVLEKEFSDKVVASIIEAVDGCPREALVMLEQVMDLPEDEAIACLSNIYCSEKEVIDLCRLIVRGEGANRWMKALEMLGKLKTSDSEEIRRAILGYIGSCLSKATTVESADRFTTMIEVLEDSIYTGGKASLMAMIYKVSII